MKLNYLTYQTFPADTANSLQTITHLKYFSRNKVDVCLIFPLREKGSNGSLENLQSFYEFDEDFEIQALSHKLPFGRVEKGIKLAYLFSHLFWSYSAVKKVLKEKEGENFITRSDWIFYFLSRKGQKVIFECHQITRMRKYLVKKSLNNPSSSLICLTSYILKDLELNTKKYGDRIKIIPSAYDEDYYKEIKTTSGKRSRLIYAGRLTRFGEERGLGIILDAFEKKVVQDSFIIDIIGGPEKLVKNLQKKIDSRGLGDFIVLHGQQKRSKTIELIQKADIGLLIYDNSNISLPNFYHLNFYTSPLKYFEYIRAKLQVVANDFPSHRELPFQEVINYFDNQSANSLIIAFNEALKKGRDNIYPNIEDFSMENRAKNIIEMYT